MATTSHDTSTGKSGKRARLVIFDTNALYADPFLQGERLKLISGCRNELGFKLFLPQIVLDEMRDQYLRDVQDAISRSQALQQELDRLRMGSNPMGLRIEKAATTDFELKYALVKLDKHLARQIPKLGIKFVKYSSTPHAQIAQRAIAGLRPFRHDSKHRDRGYKDAMVWEAVKAVCGKHSGPLTFITANKNDFSDPDADSKLHSDLTRDLQLSGISPTRIEVLNGTPAFIDKYIVPHLEILRDILPAINAGRYKYPDLAKLLTLSLQLWLTDRDIGESDDCGDVLKQSVRVNRLGVLRCTLTEARRTGVGSVFIKGNIQFEATVEPRTSELKAWSTPESIKSIATIDAVFDESSSKITQFSASLTIEAVHGRSAGGGNWSSIRSLHREDTEFKEILEALASDQKQLPAAEKKSLS